MLRPWHFSGEMVNLLPVGNRNHPHTLDGCKINNNSLFNRNHAFSSECGIIFEKENLVDFTALFYLRKFQPKRNSVNSSGFPYSGHTYMCEWGSVMVSSQRAVRRTHMDSLQARHRGLIGDLLELLLFLLPWLPAVFCGIMVSSCCK